MVKRVDNAVFNVFNEAKDGTFKPGVKVLGLKEHGVGYAVDENNVKLITPAMQAKVEQAKADIIAGKIKVTDYMAK